MNHKLITRIRALESLKCTFTPPVIHIISVSPDGTESAPYLFTKEGLIPIDEEGQTNPEVVGVG